MSLALGDTTHSPDNNENDTPPHTSKRPTPRESGVFFARRKPRGAKRSEAALKHPMKFRLPCSNGIHRSVRREISRGPRRDHLANRTGSVSRRWSSQSKGSLAQPHF